MPVPIVGKCLILADNICPPINRSGSTQYPRRSSGWVPAIAFPAKIHANMDAIADPC